VTSEMDTELRKELDKATVAMAKASALIKEGELIKKDVKAKILPLMASFGVTSSAVEGVGTIGYRTGAGSGIYPAKLTEVLLDHGLPAEDIPKIIEEATKKWSYDYVEFKAVKAEQ